MTFTFYSEMQTTFKPWQVRVLRDGGGVLSVIDWFIYSQPSFKASGSAWPIIPLEGFEEDRVTDPE